MRPMLLSSLTLACLLTLPFVANAEEGNGARGASAADSPAATAARSTPAAAPRNHPLAISVPAANPADVGSIDAIIAALYDVISGPAGKARDWNRMRSLFVPGARMMVAGTRADGAVSLRVLEVNDYVALSGPVLERDGFQERELARRVEHFGHVAQVFSTYEGIPGKAAPMRGVNSIQLMNDGARWWVVSLMWEAERPGLSLPARYLP